MKFLILSLLATSALALPSHHRAPLDDGKIVGGADADINDFRYQLSLHKPYGLGSGTYHFCGGSLYKTNVVLTAAHCVDGQKAGDLTVYGGQADSHYASSNSQSRDVAAIVSHVDYNSQTMINDIALLRLSSSFSTTQLVGPVATIGLKSSSTSSGSAVVSGWGTLSSGGSSPDTLQYVTVPIVDDATCDSLYRLDTIDSSMICAGDVVNGGIDSCQGDSGGPLVMDISSIRTQVGVVSWGRGCADEQYPGVYTEVSYFLDWIAQNEGSQ